MFVQVLDYLLVITLIIIIFFVLFIAFIDGLMWEFTVCFGERRCLLGFIIMSNGAIC